MSKPVDAIDVPTDLSTVLRRFAAGAGAGVITKTSVAPFERLKVLFQVQGMAIQRGEGGAAQGKPKYNGARHAITTIFREEGWRGFYRGNMANCVRVIPVYALKFPINDEAKKLILKRRPASQQHDPLSFPEMLVAGCFAGLVQVLVTYPLDLIRTRMQLSASLGSRAGSAYTGIIHCAQSIVQREGPLALYRALGPSLVMGVPYVGMQMTFYHTAKNKWRSSWLPWIRSKGITHESVDVVGMLVCGSLAGLGAQTASFPADTVRHRMQANGIDGQPRQYKNMFDCFRQVYRYEGLRAFYKGWGVNAVRALPGAAIQFTSYDLLKRFLSLDY